MACLALNMCAAAFGVSVESGNMRLDVIHDRTTFFCGPETIIGQESFDVWGQEGAARTYFDVTCDGTKIIKRAKKPEYITAEIVYTIEENGIKINLLAELRPNSGMRKLTWDIYLGPSFVMAKMRRSGKPQIALDPKQWKVWLPVDKFSLETANGDWSFTMTAEGGGRWGLRALGKSEKERKFDLMYSHLSIPADGASEKLSVEMRFTPKASYAVEKKTSDKAFSYLRALLDRYTTANSIKVGQPQTSPSLAKPLTPIAQPGASQTELLAKQVCAASANLEPSRLPSGRGVVIPHPKSYIRGVGAFVVPQTLDVACSPKHEAAWELLSNEMARYGVKVRRVDPPVAAPFVMGIASSDTTVAGACQRLGIAVNRLSSLTGGYVLVVSPKEVLLAGADGAGVIYGVQTLRQMIYSGAASAEIPVASISDWPDMKVRGFFVGRPSDEVKSEELQRLIRDTYSYFKANTIVLTLRWSDFRWKSHPEVASRRAHSVDELAAIATYARRYHLDVIPFVATYGKVGDLLTAHPEIAEEPERKPTQLDEGAYCPNRPETYTIIFDMMQEIIEATKCRTIHIGHDEIVGMAACPVCRKIPPADLFANDVNKIAGWLAQRNVQTMLWSDSLLEKARWGPLGVTAANSSPRRFITHPALEKIRKDVIIAAWHYENVTKYPAVKHFADQGFRVVGCPHKGNTNNYYMVQELKRLNQLGLLVTTWGFLGLRAPAANSVLGVTTAWNLAQPDPVHLAWWPEAVLAASLLDKHKPSRIRGSTFMPVSLESVANRAISGSEEAWFGGGSRHDLAYLPVGNVRLFGVDYQIGKKCVIVTAGDKANGHGIIPVRTKAKSLIFLQTLSLTAPGVKKETFGRYSVTYASGQRAEARITSQNATHWLSEAKRETPYEQWSHGYRWNSVLAWEGCTRDGEAVNLQAYEWVNPYPDDEIKSIEIIPQQGIPGLQIALVALTAVR